MGMKWIEDEKRFINPYQFVPLGQGVSRTALSEDCDESTISGKIHCKLYVKTPLAIPDSEMMTTDPTFDKNNRSNGTHKTYPFLRVDGKPVIAGSQLRGMIRSAFETLSDSCLSVNNVNILSARHSFPRKPGIIQWKNGAFHLYAATMRKVSRNVPPNIDSGTQLLRKWYRINGKEYETFLVTKSSEEVVCSNLKQAISDYKENVKIYKFKGEKEGKITIAQFREDNRDLNVVFYETIGSGENAIVHLSPAQISRSVFANKVQDLLKSYRSCTDWKEAEICPACKLFGIIGTKKTTASKVRFSDAHAETFKSMGKVTLKPLSSPKTTSVEFYTHRPDGAMAWTYDDKTTDYYKKFVGNRNTTFQQRELCDVTLNGRKYYLHHANLTANDYTDCRQSNQNATMELAETGSVFSFDVYFDRVTERELRQLVWTLCIGENDTDGQQQYMLGHGKPLGLGSVKIVVDTVETRTFDAKSGSYAVQTENLSGMLAETPFNTNADYFKAFMKITNVNTTQGKWDVCYPLGKVIHEDGSSRENDAASHQWFIANRSVKRTEVEWEIADTLPDIMQDDLSLPEYIGYQVKGKSGGGKFQKGGYSDRNKKYESNKGPQEQKVASSGDEKGGRWIIKGYDPSKWE